NGKGRNVRLAGSAHGWGWMPGSLPVGNALRGVPSWTERHGGRSLQTFASTPTTCFAPRPKRCDADEVKKPIQVASGPLRTPLGKDRLIRNPCPRTSYAYSRCCQPQEMSRSGSNAIQVGPQEFSPQKC